jgi:hypothetical protein
LLRIEYVRGEGGGKVGRESREDQGVRRSREEGGARRWKEKGGVRKVQTRYGGRGAWGRRMSRGKVGVADKFLSGPELGSFF